MPYEKRRGLKIIAITDQLLLNIINIILYACCFQMMFELLKTFQHLPLSPVLKLLGYSDIGAFIEHVKKNR